MEKPTTSSSVKDQAPSREALLRDTSFLLFAACLLLASIFPLIPVWTYGFRICAAVWLWSRRSYARTDWMLGSVASRGILTGLMTTVGILVVGNLGMGLGWCLSRVADVHGIPLPASTAVLFGITDFCLLAAMSRLIWLEQQAISRSHWPQIAILGSVGVIAWMYLTTILHALSVPVDASVRNLDWLRMMMNWPLCFYLGWSCQGDAARRKLFLQLVIIGAAFHAGLVIAQHMVCDFAYVLATRSSFDDYFVRARGNYYNHGTVGQFLLMGLFSCLLSQGMNLSRRWLWGAGGLIAVALELNGTRALSLMIVLGVSVFVACLVVRIRRRSRSACHGLVFALCLPAMFAGSIFYVKPTIAKRSSSSTLATDLVNAKSSPTRLMESSIERIVASFVSSTKATEFVSSNSFRTKLLEVSIQEILLTPVLGQGPGNIHIEYRNATKCDSSHGLFVDLALAGGIPAIAFVAIWFAGAVGMLWRELSGTDRAIDDGVFLSAALGLGTSMAGSFLFFGIERCDTIAIMAAVSGFVLGSSQCENSYINRLSRSAPLHSDSKLYLGSAGLGIFVATMIALVEFESFIRPMIGLVSVGILGSLAIAILHRCLMRGQLSRNCYWLAAVSCMAGATGAALTSTCYGWPAVEFIWSEMRDPLWKINPRKTVYTNSPALTWLLENGSSVMGRPWSVETLRDDPSSLPVSGKVLWDNARDRHYPQLISHFGYPDEVPGTRTVTFKLPESWSLVKSRQMTVCFVEIRGAVPFDRGNEEKASSSIRPCPEVPRASHGEPRAELAGRSSDGLRPGAAPRPGAGR